MKKYKFITIQQENGVLFEDKPIYCIIDNKSGEELGMLFYHKPGKQYFFEGYLNCMFNDSCLRDILDFMENVINK